MPFDASHLWFSGRVYGHLSPKKVLLDRLKLHINIAHKGEVKQQRQARKV